MEKTSTELATMIRRFGKNQRSVTFHASSGFEISGIVEGLTEEIVSVKQHGTGFTVYLLLGSIIAITDATVYLDLSLNRPE